MTDERRAGLALIAGSLGGLLTMAIHPTGAASLSVPEIAHLGVVSAVAHSIAMVSVLSMFLGACGLAQHLAAADRIAFAATVIYGFSCVAILIAAAVSGFIIPAIMEHMVRDVPAAAHQWQIVISAIFQINQGFARIFAVGASAAVILWSISALRNRRLGRGVSIYGCVTALLTMAGVGSGYLRLDVHGMGIIALGQAVWFVIVGIQLLAR